MKRVVGALLVACMCIALGFSVNKSREDDISLVSYPTRSMPGAEAK